MRVGTNKSRGLSRPLAVLQNVLVGDGCWAWVGSAHPSGYGRFREVDGGKVVSRRAHRAVYELMVGPIPDSLVMDHLCRNPNCVRPSHLEPVTDRENVLRGVSMAAVNAKKDRCIRGHMFDSVNTWFKRNVRTGKTQRQCRECNRISARKYMALRRERTPRPARVLRTHCKWGHEFNSETTGWQRTGRRCLVCKRVTDGRYKSARSLNGHA